jgi:hypothetical protein
LAIKPSVLKVATVKKLIALKDTVSASALEINAQNIVNVSVVATADLIIFI